MGTHTQRGFTIIELVLVIAVTGLLMASLLVGTGSAVSAQRYRDAVQTLRDTLQTQYSQLTSVQNARSNDWSCDATNAATTEGGPLSVNRGQSNCVLLGRLLTISGGDMTTYSVIGNQLTEPDPATSTDMTVLTNNYVLNYAPAMTTKTKLEWGTEIAWTKKNPGVDYRAVRTPRVFSILFITAPTSGQTYTFTSDASVTLPPTPSSLKQMIVAADAVPGRAQRVLCVESDGLVPVSNMGIYIAPKAAGSSAIESRSNELLIGTAQC